MTLADPQTAIEQRFTARAKFPMACHRLFDCEPALERHSFCASEAHTVREQSSCLLCHVAARVGRVHSMIRNSFSLVLCVASTSVSYSSTSSALKLIRHTSCHQQCVLCRMLCKSMSVGYGRGMWHVGLQVLRLVVCVIVACASCCCWLAFVFFACRARLVCLCLV